MKKKILFTILLLLIIAPLNVRAVNDVILSCNKTKLKANEETSCIVSVSNLNFIVTDVTGSISTGANLSITSSSYDKDIWLSLDNVFNVNSINLIRNANNQVSSLVIAKFNIKANSAASGTSSVSFSNVAFGNSDYQSVPLTSTPLTISFASKVNSLSSLSVSGANINFNSNQTTYSINVDSSSIQVSAIATDSKATITGIGTHQLNYGNNVINVIVTAEDGSQKTYTINVNRKDTRSSNNNLKSLSLSSGKISFNKSTTTYSVNVDSNISNIKISATLDDAKASFVDGYGPRTVDLAYGNNKIYIKVKSENQIEKTYTINITRKDDRSNNNNLKSITLSDGKIDFSKGNTKYTVNVPYEIEKFKISAASEDKKAVIEIIGEENLIVGENSYIIKVTAENGDVKEYHITVIRDEKITVTSSNKASNIEVEGYDIDFDPDKYSYDIDTNDKKLKIKVSLQDENATFKIVGNKNLEDGNIISIVVTDEEGNSNIYKITIHNVEEKVTFNFNIIIYILLVISLLGNIIFIGLILKRKLMNKNNSK
ncbi:MAG: cadherin-like beta sandwich domain-containing protein [Bacilli bacterium]|nr:cadherin-like beta sandwich domain-containing protein [Bacilli bacterium]